jgi:hypothetical protein
MTPQQMGEVILANIETTKAVLEDGQTGYVLQTADEKHLLCEQRGVLRLGSPQDDAVWVSASYARAMVTRSVWNGNEDNQPVEVKLRREALEAYIARLEQGLNILYALIDMGNAIDQAKKEQPS